MVGGRKEKAWYMCWNKMVYPRFYQGQTRICMLTCDALPASVACSQKATGLSNASHTLHPKEGHTGEREVVLV